MQGRKDRCLVLRGIVAGHIFRAHDLKRKCDGGSQHQQGINGSGVSKPGWPQHPRCQDVVDQVGNSNQSRTGKHGETAAKKFLPQLLRLRSSPTSRGGMCRIVDTRFFDERHCAAKANLEQSEAHNWK